MAKQTTLQELADFPAIQQIQAALWETADVRGAAVFVGAGFSRNAILPAPDSPKPPLWADFSQAMRKALYRDPEEENASSDPLRLAEEYKAILGSAALYSLIYDLVCDTEWRPGPLHARLIDLPWTDILTTNWDTLLEKAAEATQREDTYGVVRTIAEIARAHSPRIVKLHGSMPSNHPFIFTEEDYRTYPRTFAPFVNLVQQVLMENELCLLGFSGNDPNFLQWSGWIRDQLGESARRIYLVGALNLSPAYRKYLEARKVITIDLSPLVEGVDAEQRQSEACAIFLDFLHNSKPRPASEWLSRKQSIRLQQLLATSVNNPDRAALFRAVQEMTAEWRKDREAYPGWIVCPSRDRSRVRHEIGNPEYVLRQVKEQLSGPGGDEALYEVAWRLDLTFFGFSEWFRGLLANTIENSSSTLSRAQRIEIALILLRAAREEQDQSSFDRWIAFLQANAATDSNTLAAVAYEQSLLALEHLDYPALESLVKHIIGEDPSWKIRRASLHFELGDFEQGITLANQALQDFRSRYLRDRRSIWNISRLAWALFVVRAGGRDSGQLQSEDPLVSSNEWPEYFARNRCLPWDEISDLDADFGEEFREHAESVRQNQPGFDAGTYRESVKLMGSAGWAERDTKRLMEIVGLPTVIGSADLMRFRLSRLLKLSGQLEERDFILAIRVASGPSDKLIERVFSRVAVARMPGKTVLKLIRILWAAIDFGRTHFGRSSTPRPGHCDFWVERVRVMVEILSRLVVRSDEDDAVAAFHRAASLAHSPDSQYWILFEPLGNLLSRTFEAIAPITRRGLLVEILNLPLPDEKGVYGRGARGAHDEWPELMLKLLDETERFRADEMGLSTRISTLLSKINESDSLTRERSALRLLVLFRMHLLTDQQSTAFGQALWSKRESNSSFPQDTGLAPHVFFDIPGHDQADVERVFRINVVAKAVSGSAGPDELREIAAACREKGDGTRTLNLASDEALKIFDFLLAWKPRAIPIDLDRYNKKMTDLFGSLLVEAILPAVSAESLGPDRIEQLFSNFRNGTLGSGLIAAPDFVRLDSSRRDRVIDLVRRVVFSRKSDAVVYGLGAIQRWRLLGSRDLLERLPIELTQTVVAVLTSTREPWLSSALYIAERLLKDGAFNDGDKDELVFTLERLLLETAYSSLDSADERAINITHVRTRCVKLADALMKQGVISEALQSWVDNSKTDPVPEVRYALSAAEN